MSISDRLDLQDLVYDYATALDGRALEAFTALFTSDAHLGVYEPDADTPLVGYDGPGIGNAMSLLDEYEQTMHVVSNARFVLDGDTASGVVYCLAHHIVVQDGERPHDLVMAIRYVDRYRRTAAGWRFEHRRITRYWDQIHPIVATPPKV